MTTARTPATNNNRFVFVVLYQQYVYADFECGDGPDYKDILTIDNPSIKGIFTTKLAARKHLNSLINDERECSGSREYAKHLKEDHYYIEKHALH